MDYQFINITTFRSVSTEAEHFYATIGEPKHAQENLLTMAGASPETGVMFVNGKNLLHMPSYDEAKDIYLKDHYNVRNVSKQSSDIYSYVIYQSCFFRAPCCKTRSGHVNDESLTFENSDYTNRVSAGTFCQFRLIFGFINGCQLLEVNVPFSIICSVFDFLNSD